MGSYNLKLQTLPLQRLLGVLEKMRWIEEVNEIL